MGFSLFSWGRWEHENVRRRIKRAVVIINFLPILYFIPIYLFLGYYHNQPEYNQVLGTFLMSYPVFLFQRIMLSCIGNHADRLYCDIDFKYAPNLMNRIKGTSGNQDVGLKFYLIVGILGFLLTFGWDVLRFLTLVD